MNTAPGLPKRRGGARMRLRGLLRKEAWQIVRDPSSLAIAFVMPVVLLLLFGYGVSLDAKHVPVALVVAQPSAAATDFTASFDHSPYFAPEPMANMRVAEHALLAGTVDGIVHLQADFANRLDNGGNAPIQVIVNGVDANTAGIVKGYVQGLWSNWLQRRAEAAGHTLATPVKLVPRVWFNAEMRSRNYLVPGLVVVIMTLIGAMLTALVVAREWERGTMEALMVTPVTIGEILIGKLVPYFILGMGSMTLSVAMAVWLFDVPFRGSFAVLAATSALFLLVALGMGLLISVIAKNQFVAGMIALVATFLPAFILSGFIFDINSMPLFIRLLTHIVAARYFVAIVQSLFLAGDVWGVILPNAAALLIMAALFLGISRRKSRKRLE